jgi:hypothetical protein
VWAAQFSNNAYLLNDGNISGFETSADDLFVSYWFNSATTIPLNQFVLSYMNPTAANTILQIAHMSNSKRGTVFWYIYVADGSGTRGMTGQSSEGSIANNGGNHNIMVQVKTQTGQIIPYYDNAPLSGFALRSDAYPFSIPFYEDVRGLPLRWAVGGAASQGSGAYYTGSLAEFVLFAGYPQIDITSATDRAAFYDPSTGTPPPFNHITSDGSNFISGITPQIYLSGPGGIFGLNKKAASNDGSRMTIDRGDQDFFYPPGPPIQTASVDPWNNVGV